MTRIEEIAAKHVGYEDETRPACDVNYLVDELKDRDEQLAALEAELRQRANDLRGSGIESVALVLEGLADRILHPKGE